MKISTRALSKILVIVISLSFLNISYISNFQYASAQQISSISNDDLRPKIGDYWVYELIEIGDVVGDEYNFEINYTLTSELKTKVAGEEIIVFIVEGIGKVTKWSPKYKEADKAEMKIVKRIRKDNLEMIRKSRFFDLEFHEDGNITTAYDYTNITYNYTKFNKPNEISLGATWQKEVTSIKETKFKTYSGVTSLPDDPPMEFISNSTLFFDNILEVTVPAGTFNTFQITEWQYTRRYDNVNESWIYMKDTEVDYYYAKEVKGYVKRVVKDITGDITESEELLKYNQKKSGNGNGKKNGDEDDEKTFGFLDLQDKNVQIVLGVSCIILACILIGYISFKRRKTAKDLDKKSDTKVAQEKTKNKVKGRGKTGKKNE